MRTDNSHHIVRAAQQRHELTRSKALATLRELENRDFTITFESVAAAAGVSRSWLYSQPDLREEIIRLRGTGGTDRTRQRPRESTSDNSLRTRLRMAQDRIGALTAENAELRHQLALALGHARTTFPRGNGASNR